MSIIRHNFDVSELTLHPLTVSSYLLSCLLFAFLVVVLHRKSVMWSPYGGGRRNAASRKLDEVGSYRWWSLR